MIDIIQQRTDRTSNNKLYINKGKLELHFNRDIINKDLHNLESLEPTDNKIDDKNIHKLAKYLNNLLTDLKDTDSISISWKADKDKKSNLVETKGVKFINEPVYGIVTSNYIEVQPGETIIDVNLSMLANIITLDYVYKDLGETHESIERQLSDVGISSYNSPNILMEIEDISRGNIFETSKSLMISDSEYLMSDGKITDYFYSKTFKSSTYNDVIRYSCKLANTIIMDAILKENKSVYPILIDETSLLMMCNKDNIDKALKIIKGGVSIRVFGRHFKIDPEVNVY